ncbi:hypothetical protein GCM10010271_00250 [Streptomyces kurssanovii]|nr:hypothetical protein GCM10010271_00250 [Streptomyces kurssanovii]
MQHEPRVVALGVEATRFDRWYTPTAICTPARASLLTGQAPFRPKLLANHGRNVGHLEDLPEGRSTFSRALRESGYNCGLIGKWHVGNERTAADYGFDGPELPGWHNPVDHPDHLAYLAERGLPPYGISDRVRGTRTGAPTGAAPRVPAPTSPTARTTPSSTSPGTTRPRTRDGPASACPPRPRGVRRARRPVRPPLRLGRRAHPRRPVALQRLAGRFPHTNTADDGHLSTAPVKSYRPNGFGLWNTAGNVWEWCTDWFSPAYYAQAPADDPHGPETGTARVMRGGSYLCHDSYCNRYRVAARSSNNPDSSSGNLGFRCANDA